MNLRYFTIPAISILTIFYSCSGSESGNPEQLNKGNESLNDTVKHMDTASTQVSSLPMEEDAFWSIIEKSRAASRGQYETQIHALEQILVALKPFEIEKFDRRFTELLAASYDWKLWGAAYVINGGCSDDCFDYFRQYLIAHGKEKFYQTLKDPESCADWIKSDEQEEWEGLQYAAMNAYKQKTGRELPQYNIARFELKGKPFDEETVDKQYPKLAKKFS